MGFNRHKLLIRADADTAIGHGHVMRMIALAQAWIAKGGEVGFICANVPAKLEERLRLEGCLVNRLTSGIEVGSSSDCSETGLIANDWDAEAIVVDGYRFTTQYCQTLKTSFKGRVVGMADSMPEPEMLSTLDLCIYPCLALSSPGALLADNLLVGREFVLIRNEFKEVKQTERKISSKRGDGSDQRLLVVMGGSDPNDVTGSILGLFDSQSERLPEGLNLRVIAGGSNPHLSKLKKRMEPIGSALKCELWSAVEDMSTHLNWADLVISAAGGMVWESLYAGKQTGVVAIAENQLSFYRELIENRLCEGLGVCLVPKSGDEMNAGQLFEWIRSKSPSFSDDDWGSETVIDGEGSDRICDKIMAMIG